MSFEFHSVQPEDEQEIVDFFGKYWVPQNRLFGYLKVSNEELEPYVRLIVKRACLQPESAAVAWHVDPATGARSVACVYDGTDVCLDQVGPDLLQFYGTPAGAKIGLIAQFSADLVARFRQSALAQRMRLRPGLVFFSHHQVADPQFQNLKVSGQLIRFAADRLAKAGYQGAVAVATHQRTVAHTEAGLEHRRFQFPSQFFAVRQPFAQWTARDGTRPFASLSGHAVCFYYSPPDSLWLPKPPSPAGDDPVASLALERARATDPVSGVDPAVLEMLLDSDHCSPAAARRATDLKRHVTSVILADPVLNDGLACYGRHSPADKRADSARKFFRFVELAKVPTGSSTTADAGSSNGGSPVHQDYFDAFLKAMGTMDDAVRVRWFVHALFLETVEAQGTPAQARKWAAPARQLHITGCFAMTELAHSSHLRGLETWAKYHVNEGQFELHTPTLTALKWWIGQAAETATHAAVFARLLVPRSTDSQSPSFQDLGVHIFIVQIRDSATGRPLPGIEIGDCGPKLGMDGIDNGWIQFSHVRVPHDSMLARFSSVDFKTGKYKAAPTPALVYVTTIRERVWAVYRAHTDAGCALTVALRFAMCRRQGEPLVNVVKNNSGASSSSSSSIDLGQQQQQQQQPQLLDYVTHQVTLLPALAQLYATVFAQHRLQGLYDRLLAGLQQVPPRVDNQLLAAAHAAACGLKSFCSWWAVDAMELARRSMGGHAYSLFSGLPVRVQDFSVLTTGGGDNVVVQQQTAKYTLKALRAPAATAATDDGSQSQFVDPAVAHLRTGSQYRTRLVAPVAPPYWLSSQTDLTSLSQLRHAFRLASAYAAETAQGRLASTGSATTATATTTAAGRFNQILPHALRSAEAYAELYLLDAIMDAAQQRTAQLAADGARTRRALDLLALCFALSVVHRRFASFVECRALDPRLKRDLDDSLQTVCARIRPLTASLVDGLALPDGILRAPIAPSEANMYVEYFKAVHEHAAPAEPAAYWTDIIRPHTSQYKQQQKIAKL